jgi:ubiquinone biosynthesis protein COQ9
MTDDEQLMAVLDRVAGQGWTEAARDFPGGAAAAVDAFADWADRRMESAIDKPALDAMRVRDRITLLVRTRLEALEPYREELRQEAKYLMCNPGLGPKLVWRTADRMWRLAGDTATDFNHYTKRTLLAGVLVSTTLCWLGDDNVDHASSWAFLDRRIENVMQIGKALAKAKSADVGRVLGRVVEMAGRLRHRG